MIFHTDAEWIRLGKMALVSTGAAVGVTYVTPSTKPRTLEEFFRRVRPMGLWSETCDRADIDDRPVRRLLEGLRTTALAAVSVFAMLVGLGKFFVRPPGESIGWALALVVLSLAVTPLWWSDTVREP